MMGSHMTQDKIKKTKVTSNKLSLTPIWNILTVLMLLGTCCISSYVLILLTNPNLPVNPFPPILTSTPTPTTTYTPRVFPATWTPTSTYSPLQFGTPLPPPTTSVVSTATQQATWTPMPATATLRPGPYFVIDGSISAIPATDKNSAVGCTWLGIGGVVTSRAGNPLVGITISLSGSLDFTTYNQTTLSGAAPQYGNGGYEFYLGGTLTASQGNLYLQVVGEDGQPISDPIAITTYSDCQRNLILINFLQLQ
jgi:hypothetical protein